MARHPIPPDADRVKMTAGLRHAADPPERDERGRILSGAQAKEAQRARMLAADQARLAAAAAMLPARTPLPSRDRQGAGSPPVTRDSKNEHV